MLHRNKRCGTPCYLLLLSGGVWRCYDVGMLWALYWFACRGEEVNERIIGFLLGGDLVSAADLIPATDKGKTIVYTALFSSPDPAARVGLASTGHQRMRNLYTIHEAASCPITIVKALPRLGTRGAAAAGIRPLHPGK